MCSRTNEGVQVHSIVNEPIKHRSTHVKSLSNILRRSSIECELRKERSHVGRVPSASWEEAIAKKNSVCDKTLQEHRDWDTRVSVCGDNVFANAVQRSRNELIDIDGPEPCDESRSRSRWVLLQVLPDLESPLHKSRPEFSRGFASKCCSDNSTGWYPFDKHEAQSSQNKNRRLPGTWTGNNH